MSVIIAALNEVEVIDEQLEALAAQDYSGVFEVIVADNGSTDGLREHLFGHRLAERLALRWVDASGRPGISHARNAGCAVATGDFFAFCDADDRVHPAWLTRMTDCAREYDAVGGVLDPRENPIEVQEVRGLGPVGGQLRMSNATFPIAPGANNAVWRSVFEALGGWNEDYHPGAEDNEFYWRLQLAGYTLGHRADAVVYYRLRGDRRALWRQGNAYGRGGARLYRDFKDTCMSADPWHRTVGLILGLLISNPLLPSRFRRMSVERWIWFAANMAGRIRGSIEYRVFYL